LYKINDIFNSRLDAITFYKSVYDFTIKFRVLRTDIYLEEEEDKFKVSGEVNLISKSAGVSEVDIINHIKNSI